MTAARRRAGPKAVKQMLVVLTTSGGSYEHMRNVSGLSQESVSAWIKELRREPTRMVFIGNWLEDPRGYRTIPVFHWGPFADVPRPAKTQVQRNSEYRARKAGAQ